jgi:hypothetical protein
MPRGRLGRTPKSLKISGEKATRVKRVANAEGNGPCRCPVLVDPKAAATNSPAFGSRAVAKQTMRATPGRAGSQCGFAASRKMTSLLLSPRRRIPMNLGSPFDVVVWVRKGAGFHALRDDLLRIAVGDPCASTEYEGMVDFHWRFNSCGKP